VVETWSVSRSGAPVLMVDGKLVHSAYDPEKEAERYIDSLKLLDRPAVIIVVAPCVGYVAVSLRRRYPGARILVLNFSSSFSGDRSWWTGEQWTPNSKLSVDSYLQAHVSDWEAVRTIVVPWKQGLMAYAPASTIAAEMVLNTIRRLAANAETVRTFGYRWVRNALRLCRIARNVIPLPQSPKIMVVVAAGPSLEEAAASLSEHRDRFFIIAASSALLALLARKVRPDLAVSTDGTFWAGEHLYAALRHDIPIAVAAWSTQLSACASSPIAVIDDGTRWQRLLLKMEGFPSVSFTGRGTVTATAVDIALSSGAGPVYLVGVDFGMKGALQHARPYSLDRYHEETANRTKPICTGDFERSTMAGTQRAFDVYRAWFASRPESWKDRIVFVAEGTGGIPPGYRRVQRVLEALEEPPKSGGISELAKESAAVLRTPNAPSSETLRMIISQGARVLRSTLEARPVPGVELGDQAQAFIELSELLGLEELFALQDAETPEAKRVALDALEGVILKKLRRG